VLHAYLDARLARRWEEACSYLSATVVATLEQFGATYSGEKEIDDCPGVLEAFTATTDQASLKQSAQADVGSLRFQGRRNEIRVPRRPGRRSMEALGPGCDPAALRTLGTPPQTRSRPVRKLGRLRADPGASL
jgi:hypothetical protein